MTEHPTNYHIEPEDQWIDVEVDNFGKGKKKAKLVGKENPITYYRGRPIPDGMMLINDGKQVRSVHKRWVRRT